ncbi:MAG: hypothetical protein KDD61_06575 [Bdellovibrionales bacterium]|nr:hypothetical protein [Bdellovibrionales bacterium]
MVKIFYTILMMVVAAPLAWSQVGSPNDRMIEINKSTLLVSEFQFSLGDTNFKGVSSYAIEVLKKELVNYTHTTGGFSPQTPLRVKLRDPGFLNYLSQRYNPNHTGEDAFGNKVKGQNPLRIRGRKILDPSMERVWNDLMRLTGDFNANTLSAERMGYWESAQFRRHYDRFLKEILWPRIQKVSNNNGQLPTGLIKVEIEKVEDPTTKRTHNVYRYHFNKDRQHSLVLGMDKMEAEVIEARYPLIPDAELMKFSFKEAFGTNAIKTVKSLPSQTIGFAAATCMVSGFGLMRRSLPEYSLGSWEMLPGYNDTPTDFKTACTQFFDKDTVIDIGAWANFGVFIYAHKIADSAMGSFNFMRRYQIMRSKLNRTYRQGTGRFKVHQPHKWTMFMAGQLRNFVGLGFGSFVSGLASDLWLTGYDCTLGYYKDEPEDVAKKQEWLLHREGCDLAYGRFIRGDAMEKHFAGAPALGAAAIASALHRLLIDQNVINLLDKMAAKNIKVAQKVRSAFAAVGRTKVVPFIYNLILFLQWDEFLHPYIAKPYESKIVARKMDKIENKLYEEMQAFKANNWTIPNKKRANECIRPGFQFFDLVRVEMKMHDLYQRKYPGVYRPNPESKTLERPESSMDVCFDETLFETIDDYVNVQKQWRDFKLEKANEEYNSHLEGMTLAADKYNATRIVYTDFIEKVQKHSSILFYDENPLAGIKGIAINEENKPVEVVDDGTYSVPQMQAYQKVHVYSGGKILEKALSDVGKVDPEKEPNFYKVVNEFSQIQKILSSDGRDLKKYLPYLYRAAFDKALERTKLSPFALYKKVKGQTYNVNGGEVNASKIVELQQAKSQWPEAPNTVQVTQLLGEWFFHTDVLAKRIDPHAYLLKSGIDQLNKQRLHYNKWCVEAAVVVERDRLIEELHHEHSAVCDHPVKDVTGRYPGIPSDEDIAKKIMSESNPENHKRLLPCVIAEAVSLDLKSDFDGIDPHRKYALDLNMMLVAEGIENEELKSDVLSIHPEQISEHLLAKMACGEETVVAQRGFFSKVWNKVTGGDDQNTVDLFSQPVGWSRNFRIPSIVESREDSKEFCRHYEEDHMNPSEIRGWKNASFSIFDWDKLKALPTRFKNPKANYKNLIFYLRDNIRRDLIEPSAFAYWWEDTVDGTFREITYYIEQNYRKVMRRGFLPALYGNVDKMQEVDLDCNDGLPLPDWTLVLPAWTEIDMAKGMSQGNVRSTYIGPNNSKPGSGEVQVVPVHQYPPKFYSRKEIRTCLHNRKDYLPVTGSVRLELEMLINEVMRPIFISQFEGAKNPFSKDKQMAQHLFNQRVKEIYQRMDELIDYKLARDFGQGFCGTGDDIDEEYADYLPRAYKCEEKAKAQFHNLLASIFALKMDMGLMHPDQQIVKGLFEGAEMAPQGHQPSPEDLVSLDDNFRRPDQQNLAMNNNIPTWEQGQDDQGRTFYINPYVYQKVPFDVERPYQRLTKDQQAIVIITTAKMAALAQEVFNYQRMINDLNFNF